MEKELQRKYLQLQLMKQQMNGLLEEKMMLDEKINEIMVAIDAVEKLKGIKKGQEIWSPLGGITFVRSDIKDTDNVLIGIGSGIVIDKKKEDAIAMLKARLDDFKKADNELMLEINKYNEQVSKLEPEVQKLAQQEHEKEQ